MQFDCFHQQEQENLVSFCDEGNATNQTKKRYIRAICVSKTATTKG